MSHEFLLYKDVESLGSDEHPLQWYRNDIAVVGEVRSLPPIFFNLICGLCVSESNSIISDAF